MKQKRYTLQFKHKVVRELLDGASYREVAEKHKCSIPALQGWKRHYKDAVNAENEEIPTEVKKFKKERTLLTDQNVLEFTNPDPDYVYRGVTEDDRRVGRVEKYKLAGWEPVPKTDGSFGQSSVARAETPGSMIARESGLGSTTYLMRKRREWEEEDMEKVQARANADEEAIFGELDKPGRFGSISLRGRTETR